MTRVLEAAISAADCDLGTHIATVGTIVPAIDKSKHYWLQDEVGSRRVPGWTERRVGAGQVRSDQ